MGLYRRGKLYWMNYTVNGEQVRQSCGTNSFQDAKRKYEQKLQSMQEIKPVFSFDDLLKWYLDHPVPKRRKSYYRFIEMGRKLTEYFERINVSDIKPVDVERFQDWMLKSLTFKKTAYKPQTVNLHVALLKRMFNLAVRDGLVEKNPCWKVSHLPPNNIRDRIVSPIEFELLKRELSKYELILSLGYYLGMRRGEILTLKDNQIHFSNGSFDGYIHLTDTKNGDERLVPFNGEIGQLLRNQISVTNAGKLLKITGSGFRSLWDRACKKLNLKGLHFHDLRHTAITNMRKAGIDTSVIMAISGHKTMAMFMRYNKVDLCDKMQALSSLNHYLKVRYEPHALTD